jgi:hypothetical protein
MHSFDKFLFLTYNLRVFARSRSEQEDLAQFQRGERVIGVDGTLGKKPIRYVISPKLTRDPHEAATMASEVARRVAPGHGPPIGPVEGIDFSPLGLDRPIGVLIGTGEKLRLADPNQVVEEEARLSGALIQYLRDRQPPQRRRRS